jgi:hypothetical protein
MRAMAALFALSLVACEGVPDITFASADAGQDGSVDGGDDGSSEAGGDDGGEGGTCTLLDGGTTCCGANSCAGDCGSMGCMLCAQSCSATSQICCIRNGMLRCILPGSPCR